MANAIDPNYEDEPSGCTATAVLITDKNVLYVVGSLFSGLWGLFRQMPAIHGQFLAERVSLFHYQRIINLTKRVL